MSVRDDNSVFASLQRVAGTKYSRSTYNKDILDTYILHEARDRGIRLPTGGPPEEYKYLGAWVDATAGMHYHDLYIDVGSMYPNGIVTLNASPETIVGTQADLEASEYTEEDVVWGYIDTRPVKHLDSGESWQQYTDGTYKMVYDPHAPSVKWTCDERDGPQYEKLYFLDHDVKKGFLTDTVEDLIDLKNQYRGTSLYASTKRVTNSVYGVTGFATKESSFRLFDWRLAEAITLMGRKMIQFSRDYVLEYLHDNGFEDAYASHGDTDGCGISVPSASTRDRAFEIVEEAVELLNNEGYDDFFETQFGVDPSQHRGTIEIESYSPKVFIPSTDPPHGEAGVKKRRVEWITWDDDDGENIDEIDITGLEAERSDVAPITKDAQREFGQTLRMDEGEGREYLFPTLREWAEDIKNGDIDLDYVAKRKGIGQNLHEYGTSTRRPAPIYRGAKYVNENLSGMTIQRGDKPRLIYLTDVRGDYPSVYDATTAEDGDRVDAIALPDASLLPDEFIVDWERHFEKVLKDPMDPLLETRGWPWDDVHYLHSQSGLEAFS